jgi:hypothetical protein
MKNIEQWLVAAIGILIAFCAGLFILSMIFRCDHQWENGSVHTYRQLTDSTGVVIDLDFRVCKACDQMQSETSARITRLP